MAQADSVWELADWQNRGAEHRISGNTDAVHDSIREMLTFEHQPMPPETGMLSPNEGSADTRERQESERERPIISVPRLSDMIPEVSRAEAPARFTLLQKFEGTVLARSDQEFTAILREKGEPDEQAAFDTEEVPEGDRDLIVPGAVFHWSIGYTDRRGQRSRESIIRFRRLPMWTRREIARAEREADEVIATLRWGEPRPAR